MSPSVPSVHRRVFDGLFVHAHAPEGAFKEALREIGYDLDHPCDKYDTAVWRRAILVARRFVYADHPDTVAFRRLGQDFVRGFSKTLIGSVFAAATPILGPSRVIHRLPRYVNTARDDLALTVEALGERAYRAAFQDAHPAPDFIAGIFEAIIELTGAVPDVAVTRSDASGFELTVRWRPRGA